MVFFLKEEVFGSDGNIKDVYIIFYGSLGSLSEFFIDLCI